MERRLFFIASRHLTSRRGFIKNNIMTGDHISLKMIIGGRYSLGITILREGSFYFTWRSYYYDRVGGGGVL